MATQDTQSFDTQRPHDRLLGNYGLEQISIEDWAATPESVKQLVSSLLVQQLDQGIASEHKSEYQKPQRVMRREVPASNNAQENTPSNTQDSTQDNTQDISNHSRGNHGGDYSLTQFLEATSVGIAVHDAAGNLVYINQAGKDLLTETGGFVEKAETLPQAFHIYRSTTQQLYPLEELPSSLALAGEKAQADDLELHHPDRVIPLEVVANPVFDSKGQVIHVIATFQDITQRRQAEQALAAAMISYQQVVEAQTDFVLRSSPDTLISFANPAICRALGLTLEEIIGQKWIDFANLEDLQDILKKITELTPNNSIFLAENRDRRGDGSIGWTQWLNQGIFNPQGELVEIQSVGRDITFLKRTMVALQESEARFRSIIDNIPGALFRYLRRSDGSEQLLYASPSCYELFGVVAEVAEANVGALSELVHPEDLPDLYESIVISSQNLQPWDWQFRLITPSGQQKWVQGIGKPELTPEGAVVWDILALDISKQQVALQERQQVELELQNQKALLKLVFDYMPVLVSIFSQEGEVLMVNRHLEQVLGWNQTDYKTIDVLRECYPDPEDYEATKAYINRADSTWREFKTRVRDGRLLDMRWIQIRLADGRSMSIGQDITEQKRLIASLAAMNQELELRVAQRTEALEKQDALLQESQRVARLGSWEMIPLTEEVHWSSEMFQIFGYDPSQPAPNVSQQRRNFAPEDWQHLMEMVDRAVKFGESYALDLQIIREDGSLGYVFAKGQPSFDETGRVQRLVGVAMDISDRKAAEQEIIRNRDLREAIFNELADALFLVDAETLLTLDCNRKAMELFRVSHKAELIGIEGHFLQRYQFTAEELVAIEQQMAAQGFWSRELEYVTRQGSFFWGNIAAKPIVVAGKTMNLVRVTDISDRKHIEAKNQKIAQKLAAANRELEAFAYSVSHDLRSPLRAIDGFSQALMEDYGDQFDEEAKDYFHRIHRAVERMGSLIDDLLRLSRVSRAEIQYSQVNLTEVAEEIVTELRTSRPDRQVEFLITPGLMVYADSNLLRVALENLLQNAWKFTSHHSTARIEVGTIESSRTDSSQQIDPKDNQEQGEDIVYFVRDDGAGFDMAYASMLFGVFQRLHNTNEFPGTGIGLATVQRVIHRHGGRIWAEGIVEAGATIYFTIPHNLD
jgi:PAS domain S-box-containing protein